jgi:integrase/recombinase XerD
MGPTMPPEHHPPSPPTNALIAARAEEPERDHGVAIPLDATEEHLIELWLHGKSPNTIRAYRQDITAFRACIGKPIRQASLLDLQCYADTLQGSNASRARRLLAVKSLLSFAARMGYAPFNVGAAIRPPRPDDRLAERILQERQVFALLDALENHPRDHALIRLLYNGGLRVSEAVTLQWRNLVDGVANIRGKGGRSRVVRLSLGTWQELQALRSTDALSDDRVFPMTAWNAWDRVRRAARKAGLEELVSPHFLRHSHGTHALHRGSDLATVRQTLGHASLSTTGRYLHARPEKSSGDYLAR